MKRLLLSVLVAGVCALLGRAASADTVRRLGSARGENGTVTAITPETVTLRRTQGNKTADVQVPAGEVEWIEYDGQPPTLMIAVHAEKQGRLDFALEKYREVAAAKPKEPVQVEVQYFLARTTARQALVDPARLAEAAKLLEAFRQQHPGSYRFYALHEWLGNVYLEQEKYAEAQQAFTALAKAPWKDYKLRALLGEARVRQRQGDYAAAIAALEQVLASSPQNAQEEQCRQEAVLAKAQCLSRQQSAAEAEKLLREVIQAAPAEAAALQARAYNLLGDCLYADRQPQEQKLKEALLAYLHVDALPHLSSQPEEHAKALYYLTKLWKETGKPDRAEDAMARLKAQYPNSPWAKRT